MPTRTKNKRRDDKLFEQGWFPLSDDMWRDPRERMQKVRLISDANFPAPLVDSIRKRKIDIKIASDLGLEKLADRDLLRRVAEQGYALITMDRDFWSDRKFPLHECGPIINIDSEGASFRKTVGFELLIAFLSSFGGGRNRLKFRASSEKLYMKGVSFVSKKFLYEIRAIRPGIYAREVEDRNECAGVYAG